MVARRGGLAGAGGVLGALVGAGVGGQRGAQKGYRKQKAFLQKVKEEGKAPERKAIPALSAIPWVGSAAAGLSGERGTKSDLFAGGAIGASAGGFLGRLAKRHSRPGGLVGRHGRLVGAAAGGYLGARQAYKAKRKYLEELAARGTKKE